MRPGTVLVDLAGEQGGNVALTKPGETIETDNGVIIAAPLDLPSSMATSASLMYARNISALLLHLVKDGQLELDFSDEITAGAVITHDGKVVQAATRKALGLDEEAPAASAPAEPAKAAP
jgi:NAD(P) transhydrogenase subunit alpha